ncbi:unnamed protein product [Acanthoscelides obtectus]|uniref:Uncharacterized protein n=1 Tax=Acanthoscelides obtectus TaxID=200917 RepID=A0A9P0M8W4_ACAOB|nr:unnamed protein product [Acanthoscelides obtectus]CAK1635022.1 hypothetical protein AOBTE_LOCUS9004 [Acanthoscelides obtectus]
MTVAAFRLFRFRASSEKLPLCLSPATALLTTLLTFLLTLGTSTVNAQDSSIAKPSPVRTVFS